MIICKAGFWRIGARSAQICLTYEYAHELVHCNNSHIHSLAMRTAAMTHKHHLASTEYTESSASCSRSLLGAPAPPLDSDSHCIYFIQY